MKKICLIVLSLSLLVSILPMNIFASINQEKQQYKTSGIKMPTKKELAGVPNELEYIKQYLKDLIYEDYMEYKNIDLSEEDGYYISEIKDSIELAYNNCIENINNATEVEEMIDLENSFFEVIFVGPLKDSYYTFIYLMKYNTDIIDDSGDLKRLKNEYANELKLIYSCYQKKYYNNYYWSKIQGLIEENQDKIKEKTSFYDLALEITQIEDIIYNELGKLGIEFLFSENSEDLEFYCPPSNEEDYLFELTSVGENILDRFEIKILPYSIYGLYLYQNNEIKNLKMEKTTLLNYYVTRQIKVAGYQGDLNELKEIVNMANEKISKSYNASEIYNIYNNYEKKLEKATGIEYKDLSYSKLIRIYENIERICLSYYDDTIYSDRSLEEIDDINYTLSNSLFYMQKEVEFPSDYEETLIEVLEEIPTKAEELQAAKIKYINALKLFKNNAKYNQTKVVPIVNEGIAKINNSTTIEGAKKIYISYYNKAKATIKKFNITTSKTGYGTITKSGIAKYGTNYTVRITPKKGYKIKKLYVDGKSIKRTNIYTFKNITKSHKIKVIFGKN